MIKLLHHNESPDGNIDQHNCLETLKKVMLALDGELDSDEQLKLQVDLKNCSWCLDKFEIEQEFKIFLAKKIEKKCCPEAMVKNIKSQISRLSGNA